ncbi:MAG: NAD(P)/FAD-dependent oxidoreductase [Solirubrobacterales bacterium]
MYREADSPGTGVWPTAPPSDSDRASYAEAEPVPFWLDRRRPARRAPLEGTNDADLVVIGGGLTGLWAALTAIERDPGRRVVVLESEGIATGASGRNGGFMSSSLVHGIANGLSRFPEEVGTLERLGLENLDQIGERIDRYGIECELGRPGAIEVAMTPAQLEELSGTEEELQSYGHQAELLDQAAMREQVNSPLFTGGLWQKTGEWSADPVALTLGLADAATELGVTIHEDSEVTGLGAEGEGVLVETAAGSIRTERALLATAAFRSPVRAIRSRVIPVFDYVLVTEPLTPSQWESVGWTTHQGLSDSSNRFHYYRPIADGRILWGGYDAIYHRGNRTDPALEHRDASHALLATQFFVTFPQLEGVRFTHKWAGLIDSTSRFTPAIGTALHGKLAYAVGYTGLGTASSRFGALTMLDLLAGRHTERTELTLVRRKPFPFPPEPLRYPLIQFTRAQLAREDATGHRGLWVRTLDRFGLGFNS